MLRLTPLAIYLPAVGLSAALHATLLLVPPASSSPLSMDLGAEVALDVTPEVAEPPPVPEPAKPEPDRATIWTSHTHPFPVPAWHDAVPHDPGLVHTAAELGDETPHFSIAVGADEGDAHGLVAPGGASGSEAPAHAHADDQPLGEHAVDVPARLVHGFAPTYPEAARAASVEGSVRLEIVVGLSGHVEQARVVQGVGHGLDEAALQAVRQFHFAPASKAGQSVRVRMGWSMQFRLE